MNKKLLLVLSIFLITALSASSQPFLEDYFESKTIIVAFDAKSVGTSGEPIEYQQVNDIIQTGMSSFNQLANEYNFVELDQVFKQIKYTKWNDAGVYMKNIYRVILDSNDNIEAALKALETDHNILFAEFETINRIYYTPNDPQFDSQWYHQTIQTPQVWDYITGSDEVKVGIVDQGVFFTHEDLRDNMWINEAELVDFDIDTILSTGVISGGDGIDNDGNGYIDDVLGYNFNSVNSNQSYQNHVENDHGTHVAGCTGAVGDNGIGVAGAAMNIKLIGTRHAPTGYAVNTVDDGYSGITYCVDTGADIINCSWGGPGSGSLATTTINYATSHGALVVSAAGNSNLEHSSSYHDYPADVPAVLNVAATDQSDNKASFSDYGQPIDISCPGVAINSTVIGGNGYSSFQGTSMASPITAGVAALVLSVNPDLTPAELKSRLENTADNIDEQNPDYIDLLGAGRINAFRAVLYDHIPNLSIDNVTFSESVELSDNDGIPNPGEICLIDIDISNADFDGGTWATASNIEIEVISDNPEITFLEGTENISIASLVGGESITISAIPIKIQIPEESATQTVQLVLNISSNASSTFPYNVELPFEVEFSLDHNGYPFNLGSSTKSAPVITNHIDGNRLFFGDSSGNIYVKDENGADVTGFPVNIGGTISSALAIGDINNDGNNDIVAALEAGAIVAIDSDGSEIFRYTLAGLIKTNPIIADIDNDDDMEIIATNLVGGEMVVLNADGSLYPNFPITLDAGTLSSSAVGDLDQNGSLEIITISITGNVNAINPTTGTNISNWPVNIGGNSSGGAVVVNIDSDTYPEVIVAKTNGDVYAINHDGTELFNRSLGCQIKGSAVVSDINNDDSADIIFASITGNIFALDSAGNNLSGFPLDIGDNIEATPVLADIDNDGALEIIFGDASGELHAINYNGDEARNFPYYVGSAISSSAALGNLDSDGDLEIVVPNSSEIVVIDFKESVSNIEWACLKKNPQRTGNYVELSMSSENATTPQLVNNLNNNYPNPFNPTTNISFSLANSGNVSLKIYNAKGQIVKTLLNKDMSHGLHKIVWNGDNSKGTAVSSGIYFYKLQSNDYVSMKKMVLLK